MPGVSLLTKFGGPVPVSDSEPCVSESDACALAKIAGVQDPDTIASLLQWLEQEIPEARSLPDLVDQLQGDEDAARKELRPLSEIAHEFAKVIRSAPHALERVRMLYAEELSDVLPVDLGLENQRRLDQDLKGMARLVAAIDATNANIRLEERTGPALLGPRKAAQRLARKYTEISYQPFQYYVPDIDNSGDPWTHPHTSPGTRFVATALKTMFPTLNDTNLKRILKELPQFTEAVEEVG